MAPAVVGQRRGTWEPLPLIVYGYAIHPLTPSSRDTRLSNRTRLSTVTEGSADFANRDVLPLEVGDDIYAFERYVPKGKECNGVWYRGYVVCVNSRPTVKWSSDPSSSSKTPRVEEPPQVFIGIFPASHIHVCDELSDTEGRLADVAAAVSNQESSSDSYATWSKERAAVLAMEASKEDEHEVFATRKSFKLVPPPEHLHASRAAPSVLSVSTLESQRFKPLPPRPSVKSGDDTASGHEQPIIDEIASALREWHSLMFQYMARRDYKLFHIVRDHVEALHLGRRQLLAKTLSAEETHNLRRDCVAKLVTGNVVQGLDVIVRHPAWGALVTVHIEGDIDTRSWVSAVRMYAMQVSLAYMNVSPESNKPSLLGSSIDYMSLSSLATPASATFSEPVRPKGHSRVMGSLASSQPLKVASAKFFHVFLDLRAFVASPCSPGETSELYFSLYNQAERRFVTEDFCVVLNHNGVLFRDPAARIRTMFLDLVQSESQEPIYLVCKIVRNGALKIGANFGSNGHADGLRHGSDMSPTESSTSLAGTYSSTYTQLLGRGSTTFEAGGQFRRPFGCAVLELKQLSEFSAEHMESSTTREYTMPIYVPANEAVFSMFHQDIIAQNMKEYEKSPRAEMLAVSIKLFHGDATTIVRENPSLLQDTPLTSRLGFPDVVFPGDVRNEIYIKLWSGEFLSSHGNGRLSMANFARGQMTPTTNNIQVTIEVRDQSGQTVENAISQGSGEPPATQFHSLVFQRNNQPTFGELLKLKLPMDELPLWHLFFTFRHRSSRERSVPRGGSEYPERPFAFAFLPLIPDNRAFLEDGSHTLVLYRANSLNQIQPEVYLNSLPWSTSVQPLAIPADLIRMAPPLRDSIVLRSALCSTKFTQNSVLLSLLNWEEIRDREMLATILAKFTFVGEVEIVKFLRNIFDSLFDILMSSVNHGGEMDNLVFNALVTVLGIVEDRRFSNFQPVLDVYIERHFNCSAASSHMIRSLNTLLSNPTGNETAMPLRAALKVWHYIVKFIVRSRELQKAKEVGVGGGVTAEHLESSFKRELSSHLAEVNRMMASQTPPSIIGTQTIAVRNFTSILPELAKVFSTVELVKIATDFASSIGTGKGKIVIWKLIMYLQIVKGFLFDISESRTILVDCVASWVKPHFGRYNEYLQTQPGDTETTKDGARVNWLESTRLCVSIIATMLDKLQQNLVNPALMANRNMLRKEQDNVECLLPLIPRLLESYREFQNSTLLQALQKVQSGVNLITYSPVSFPDSYPFSLLAHNPNVGRESNEGRQSKPVSYFNCGLAETAIVFLVLILSSPRKDLLNTFEAFIDIEGRENFGAFSTQFLKVAVSILENDAFPSNWLNVNILAHEVLIKMMDPLGMLLEREFIPDESEATPFNASLWRAVFYMLLKLMSSDQLVIEEFTSQKRRAVWRLAGDIRGEGATILLRLWEALGWPEAIAAQSGAVTRYSGLQVAMNSLVGHVVNLCLSHHDLLRNNAVQILYSMIISEYRLSGNFDDIEHELVNKLDSLFMSDSKGDDISRAFFIGHLRHLFESSGVDEQLRDRVSNFLDDVDLFLEYLLNVRQLPDGEEFADDRVIATLRLMNFIRRIGRDEIYIKYVHQLVNMHLQSQNYVEAALTLKLHSDLHAWDLNSYVEPMEDLGLPRQSQFHRKETLCLLILDYLGRGKAWESAVEICRELALQHAEVTFNYQRLSEILRHEAALLERIIQDQRYYPDYFRVAFYGNFPVAIRNKQFIYRGYEWEKFGAFCERMLNKHPGSQLLRTLGDPPVDIRFGSDQYIQCTPVQPEPNTKLPIFTNPDVPTAVRSYYEHSAVNEFSYQRPAIKITQPGDEETWILKALFTTEESFPTVLRRSEVVEVRILEISPIDSAFGDVVEKSRELTALYAKYSTLSVTGQPFSIRPLAAALDGIFDAPINGGVSLYRKSFLAAEYLARYPDRAGAVQELRDAMDNLVRVVYTCLKLHASLCPPDSISHHETLENSFRMTYDEEIMRLSIDSSDQTAGPSSPVVTTHSLPLPNGRAHMLRSSDPSSPSSNGHQPSLSIQGLPSGPQINTPSSISPSSIQAPFSLGAESVPYSKQTPLQRNLTHLVRHGITGISSGSGDNGIGNDSSAGSPQPSLVNVTRAGGSRVSVSTASGIGTSISSFKGRFSRLGSIVSGRG